MTTPVVPTPITAAPPVPNSNDPEATFDAQFEASLTWQAGDLRTGANALAAATYTNAVAALEAAMAAGDSAAQADEAKMAAEAAQAAAEGVVATIPEGTINDGTTSGTSVWSSSKVSTEMLAATANSTPHLFNLTAGVI